MLHATLVPLITPAMFAAVHMLQLWPSAVVAWFKAEMAEAGAGPGGTRAAYGQRGGWRRGVAVRVVSWRGGRRV